MRVRVERMGLSRFEPCEGRNVLIGMKVTGTNRRFIYSRANPTCQDIFPEFSLLLVR